MYSLHILSYFPSIDTHEVCNQICGGTEQMEAFENDIKLIIKSLIANPPPPPKFNGYHLH